MTTPLHAFTREQLIEHYEMSMQREREHTEVVAQYEARVIDLEQTVAAQSTEIDAREKDVTYLTFQLNDLRRMLFASKSERFISAACDTQYALPFAVDADAVAVAVEAERTQISYERKKSAAKKHIGRVIDFPEHLPVRTTVVEPACDTTGMVCIGEEITKELDLTPGQLFVHHIVRPRYAAAEAEDGSVEIVIAPMPARPIDKCMAGIDLLTTMIIDKHLHHIPDYRQIARFELQGVSIPASTMGSWQQNISELLRPLHAALRSVVMQTDYLQVDETRLPVQDRTKQGTTHKGYLWAVHAPLIKVVYFEYMKGRGEVHCRELLQNHSGFLQTDDYAAYHKHKQREDVVGVACWAHARRYFEKALDEDRSRATLVMTMIQKLYDVERTARGGTLSHAERQDLRMALAAPLAHELFNWMKQQVVLPRTPMGKALAYALRLERELLVYLTDGRLEIDNNLIENAIRPVALGRKNWLFAGSHDAAQNTAMYRSFFATCLLNGINPYKWLRYVLLHVNSTAPVNYHTLLPCFIDPSLLD